MKQEVTDGTWHTIERDLESELQEFEPDNSIVKITSFKIRSTGDIFVDNLNSPPCITRDELYQMIRNNEDVTQVNRECITDMSGLFQDRVSFNQDISNWDVSNVTNMEKMFYRAKVFNQPLNEWDVSNSVYSYERFSYMSGLQYDYRPLFK